MRTGTVLLALGLLTLAPTLGAQSGLTLEAAAAEALSHHPAISAAEAQEQVARARRAEARSSYLPQVELTENMTRSNNPVFVFGTLLEQGRFAPRHFDPGFLNAPDALTNFRAALSARAVLFDGMRTSSQVRQAGHVLTRAGLELADARRNVQAAVVARYYGVILAEEQVAVAREAVRAAEADSRATRDRFSEGLLVESDPLSADVQLAGLRQRLIAAEGDLAVARAALAILLGRPPAEPIQLAGTLPTSHDEDRDLAAAIVHAVEMRVPVKLAESQTAGARVRLAAERGAMLPRVDLFGSFGASGATLGSRDTDATGGIAIRLAILDRARPARIAAARAEIDAATAGETAARDAVTMEVIAAWHRLRSARESADVAVAAVAQAEVAARIVRDRYEHGLTTITEHLQAQTALVTARFQGLAARYEITLAHVELLRATGELQDVQPFV